MQVLITPLTDTVLCGTVQAGLKQAFAVAWAEIQLRTLLGLLDAGAAHPAAVTTSYTRTYTGLRTWIRHRTRHLSAEERERVDAYLTEHAPSPDVPHPFRGGALPRRRRR